MMMRRFLVDAGAILVLFLIAAIDSKVELSWNPGCTLPSCNSSEPAIGLLHAVISNGAKDPRTHWLISNVAGFAFAMGRETPGKPSDLKVSWADFMTGKENTVSFDPPLNYTFMSTFYQLVEYNDTGDTAKLADSELRCEIDFEKLIFTRPTILAERNVVTFKAQNYSGICNGSDALLLNDGFFSIAVGLDDVGTTDDPTRPPYPPKLALYSGNGVVNFTLDRLNPRWPGSRFALKTASTTSTSCGGAKAGKSTSDQTPSIDDEYSPGVFRTYTWQREPSSDTAAGSFMQYRASCFVWTDLALQNSTQVVTTDLRTLNSTEVSDGFFGLARSLYGEKTITSSCAWDSTTAQLGRSKDRFYANTNYTLWTFSLGLGDAPDDSLSPVILVVLSVGIGLPFVVLVFGGVGVFVKKKMEKKERELNGLINDTDEPATSNRG